MYSAKESLPLFAGIAISATAADAAEKALETLRRCGVVPLCCTQDISGSQTDSCFFSPLISFCDHWSQVVCRGILLIRLSRCVWQKSLIGKPNLQRFYDLTKLLPLTPGAWELYRLWMFRLNSAYLHAFLRLHVSCTDQCATAWMWNDMASIFPRIYAW